MVEAWEHHGGDTKHRGGRLKKLIKKPWKKKKYTTLHNDQEGLLQSLTGSQAGSARAGRTIEVLPGDEDLPDCQVQASTHRTDSSHVTHGGSHAHAQHSVYFETETEMGTQFIHQAAYSNKNKTKKTKKKRKLKKRVKKASWRTVKTGWKCFKEGMIILSSSTAGAFGFTNFVQDAATSYASQRNKPYGYSYK